jgi:17beta-estradiol 17-dehydrogenase / very-long-chain 3-oxoacyl-CoA reductase
VGKNPPRLGGGVNDCMAVARGGGSGAVWRVGAAGGRLPAGPVPLYAVPPPAARSRSPVRRPVPSPPSLLSSWGCVIYPPRGDRYGAGSWAVITGGSEGIGLGFAVELAREGFHVCLLSRSAAKLEAARAEVLAANPRVQVRLVPVDFRGGSSLAFWDELHAHVADLDVSILVNNVGINHTEHFEALDEQFLLDIVQVNCTAQAMMTRKLIGGMLRRGPRSAVIAVSSVAGQRPLLYLSPYSATKAFNDFFSRALALEFAEKIDVLSLRPGYVVSGMSKLTAKGGFVLDRYECAAGCLDKLGCAGRV